MRRRWLAIALWCVGSLTALAGAAGQTRVRITVTDASTGKPVALARVFVVGPVIREAYTDASGQTQISNIDPGAYRLRIYAPRYHPGSGSIIAHRFQTTEVTAALAPIGLPKIIASVHSVSAPSAEAHVVSGSSNLSRLFGGIGRSLPSVPDAYRVRGGYSIDGLSASMTQTSLDGVPLGGGQGDADLSDVGLDLFDAVAVDPIGSPGGPGLNLTGPSPTIAFNSGETIGFSQYGGSNLALTTRGTIGFVGFAFRTVQRSEIGRLDAQRFLDESGLFYEHRDENSGNGSLLKLRLPFSASQNLLLEAADVNVRRALSCDVASGGIPCGYGPDSSASSNSRNAVARYSVTSGRTRASVSFSRSTQNNLYDQLGRTVGGSSSPFSLSSSVRSATLQGSVEAPLAAGGGLGLLFTHSNRRFDSPQSVTGADVPFTTASLTHSGEIGIVSSTEAVQLSQGFATHLSLRWEAQAEAGPYSTVAARIRLGEPIPPPLPEAPGPGFITDTPSLSYDCLTGRVFAAGPSDSPVDPTDSGVGVDISRRKGNAAVELTLAEDTVHGAYVPTLSPASAQALAAFPGALQAISAFYASTSACGSAVPLAAQDIILGADRVSTLVSRRATLSAAFQFRRALVVAPYLQLNDSTANIDGVLSGALYVPRFRAGLLIDKHFRPGKTEAIVYAQYDGPNNSQGLPGAVTLDAGISQKLRRGRINMSVTNITSAYSHSFASSAFAQVLSDGILPIARPLPRTTLHFSYRLSVGGRPSPAREDALQALASVAQPARDIIVVRMNVMPPGNARHPFQADRNSSNCEPEVLGRAQAILSWMRTLDREQRTLVGTADTRYTNPSLQVSVIAHRRDHHVTFEVHYGSNLSWHAFETCANIHFTTVAAAQARGLYAPATSSPSVVFYSRAVGAYRVLSGIGGPHARRETLDSIPASAPRRPLAIRKSCPARLRPLAIEVRRVLKARASGKAASSTLFATVVHSRPTAWIELRFLDPAAFSSVARCMHMAAGSRSALAAHGVGGAGSTIDYAPGIGLYTLLP